MADRWITVFTAAMSEVLVCQGLLEANGIATFILDENMKVIDPFVTGANFFAVHLQVPKGTEAEAQRILAYRPPGARESEAKDSAPEQVRRLGVRIRWASIAAFSAPYALCLAWSYFSGARKLERRPPGHGWTVAALAFSAVLVFVTAWVWLGRLFGPSRN